MEIYALLLLAGVGLASASCPSDLAEKYTIDELMIKWCQACNQSGGWREKEFDSTM